LAFGAEVREFDQEALRRSDLRCRVSGFRFLILGVRSRIQGAVRTPGSRWSHPAPDPTMLRLSPGLDGEGQKLIVFERFVQFEKFREALYCTFVQTPRRTLDTWSDFKRKTDIHCTPFLDSFWKQLASVLGI